MQITDDSVLENFLKDNPDATVRDAFMAGLMYERRACTRMCLEINDAMARAVGKLLRVRGSAQNRHHYE